MTTEQLYLDFPTCKICGKKPEELSEYVAEAELEKITPTTYVVLNEGTYNHKTQKFYCTECYIKIGMPNGIA